MPTDHNPLRYFWLDPIWIQALLKSFVALPLPYRAIFFLPRQKTQYTDLGAGLPATHGHSTGLGGGITPKWGHLRPFLPLKANLSYRIFPGEKLLLSLKRRDSYDPAPLLSNLCREVVFQLDRKLPVSSNAINTFAVSLRIMTKKCSSSATSSSILPNCYSWLTVNWAKNRLIILKYFWLGWVVQRSPETVYWKVPSFQLLLCYPPMVLGNQDRLDLH